MVEAWDMFDFTRFVLDLQSRLMLIINEDPSPYSLICNHDSSWENTYYG